MSDLPEIEISDPYIRRRVEKVRSERGVSTLSRAAGQLILERCTQLETADQQHPCPNCSSVSETGEGENVAPEPQA